jgi:uncharacterized protein (UPF0147 family)
MIEKVVELLNQIVNDRTVPRNIRKSCQECVEILKNEKDPLPVRINAVISILDEVTNDPNIPMYTRTQVWNIVSILESMQHQ